MDEAIALLSKMTKGTQEIEMPSILGTGANSEGGVYREDLGSGFTTAPSTVGGGGGAGGGGGGAGRAVDYIHEWRDLRLVRRMVDDEVFDKQKVDFLITPTIRELPWTIEEELTRAANSRARQSEARQHARARRLRPAHHHRPLRLFEIRPSHRASDQRAEVSGRDCSGPRSRMATEDGLAHEEAIAGARRQGSGAVENGGGTDWGGGDAVASSVLWRPVKLRLRCRRSN